ncbi:MAG: hypothetical protein CFE34_19690 [Rhodobacteraceae bacterium PARR1]|nr:MAG: hypothetical protein CFE34_19690 [Rhodobacteraceae bacterium PARR1]
MKKPLLIHGFWAVAVLMAFALGSKKSASSAADADSEASVPSRLTTRASEAGSDGRSSRRSDRPAGQRENSALARLFGSIASADGNLDALFQQALRDPNQITRRLAFAKLLEAMTPENAAAMREQLVALGADPDQWRDFHYAWGALDGKAAFDHAAASPEPDLNDTMTGWAAANPAQAIDMLNQLPESLQGQRNEIIASLVSGLADGDLSAATAFVLGLGENDQSAKLMEIVASQTIRAESPEAAARWSDSLPDGPMKATAMSRVADAYARKDPEAAARWVQGAAGEGYASKAVEEIGGRWAESNPVAAVDWLQDLPASNGQIAALRSSFDNWEDGNPAAAQDYLKSMPQSSQRDSSINGFATGYAWQNPQVAIAWTQQISDPALREKSLTQVGQIYYRQNPEGASAWLETSGLSDGLRQQIQQPMQRR